MRPIHFVVFVVFLVGLSVITVWQADLSASFTAMTDAGAVKVLGISGSNVTEAFVVTPEWVERGVRCLILARPACDNPMERAQLAVALPGIQVVGISFHRIGRTVDSVVIFYTFDPDYEPPPTGFRDGDRKSIKELIDEIAQ